jgi:hypothetical protein
MFGKREKLKWMRGECGSFDVIDEIPAAEWIEVDLREKL